MDRALYAMLREKAREIRELTIREIGQLSVGHIGGAVDLAELLAVLYYHEMNIDPDNPAIRERDRFILSKGHGGPALYSVLAMKGYIDMAELDTLNRPGTNLPSHCDMNRTRGVDMTTGSLGQGFSCAVGMAIAARMDGLPSYIYTCIGDGESQEGQIWEAAMLAGNHALENLIVFTDYNKLQIDGTVAEVNDIAPLGDKWRAFGFSVREIDGHNIEEICETIQWAKSQKDRPKMIILHTIKGKGASFCEGKLSSHNMPVSRGDFEQALLEIRGGR